MENHQTTREARAVSEHLEDAGNCRQNINQEQNPCDSLLSEQRKLRHVLDWAQRFLSSGSELHREFCRAESLILATDKKKKKNEEMRETEAFEGASNENQEKFNFLCGFKSPLQDEPDFPFSRRDDLNCPEKRETENVKSVKPQHAISKQRQDDCTTNRLNRHKSDSSRNQTLASGTCRIEESRSRWRNEICENRIEEQRRRERNGAQRVQKEVKTQTEGMVEEEKEKRDAGLEAVNKISGAASSFLENANDKMNHRAVPGLLKTNLTVYEQYLLCVERLHRLRMRPGPEASCFSDSAASARPPSPSNFNPSTSNAQNEKHFRDATTKTEGSTSGNLYKKKDRTSEELYKHKDRTNGRCRQETVTKHEETKQDDNVTLKNKRRLSQTSSNRHVSQPKKTELHLKRSDVKGQKKDASGCRGPQRFKEKSRVSLSSLTNGGILPRSQSAAAAAAATIQSTKRLNTQTHTQRHTPEDRLSHTSPCRETLTRRNDDASATSQASDTEAHGRNTDCKHIVRSDDFSQPAAEPACDRWLRLPDEVWLSILSLLPHADLCRATQVCRRLHALAADHTLWKHLRVENETVTEQRLLFWGRRRPRSLSLYSCSGPSVTSQGLRVFFTLCKNYLEEVKVTSCTGPGLHGDHVLPQIGRLCDHVTSVDVSWSGATDVGVKALSGGCAGLRLESVVLNGCHVTDDPLHKVVMRHRESLCRLEVFGCQFLSAPCLQLIFEMCPRMKHLNIGQVPKVTAHSLMVMAARLRRLISLNLTGLQAVTDVTVDTLLQNCVGLESLTLSSCPGVTDLTLYNISKYTPCIRSVDVSGCRAVTDAGVQSLSLGCRRLQQLDLSSTGAGNRGVTLLANNCSEHLQTVKLSFCHITSANILKLCRHSKRLKLLYVYGCAHLPSEEAIRDVNTTVKVFPLS